MASSRTTANEPTKEAVPYLTFDEVFERVRYPAGESHIRLQTRGAGALVVGQQMSQLVIEAAVTNFEALCEVVTADRILARNGCVAQWFVPYFPFARDDRRNDMGDGFELGLALEIAQELDRAQRLTIADPHSEVAGQLRHIPQESVVELFRAAGAFKQDSVIVVPDAGAAKKTHSWSAETDTVQALKHRDTRTGKLAGFEVLSDDLGGRPCIIVDDICDGGGTFVGLAEQLRAKNAGPLSLGVTHGLFTKGVEALAAFDYIFTFASGPIDADADDTTGTTSDRAPAVTTPTIHKISFQELYEKGTRR